MVSQNNLHIFMFTDIYKPMVVFEFCVCDNVPGFGINVDVLAKDGAQIPRSTTRVFSQLTEDHEVLFPVVAHHESVRQRKANLNGVTSFQLMCVR